jgi:hypothetical protein
VKRPPEYDNLLRTGSLKEAVATSDSISQFLRTAEEMLLASAAQLPVSAAFLCAYKGAFSAETASFPVRRSTIFCLKATE